METVGERIKKIRKELKMSQQDLGGNDFTKSYISKIERDMVNPSMKALEILAARLNRSVSFFLGDQENQVTENKEFNILKLIFDAINLFDEKKYEESKGYFEKVLENKEIISDRYLAKILYHLSEIYFKQRDYHNSLHYLEELLTMEDDLDDLQLYNLYSLMGNVYYELRDRKATLEYWLKSKEIADENKDLTDYKDPLKITKNIGAVYAQMGDLQSAVKYLNSVIDVSKKNTIVSEGVLDAHRILAEIYLFDKDIEKGLYYLDQALPLFKYFNDILHLTTIYSEYVDAYYEMKNYDKSWYYVKKCKESLAEVEKMDFEFQDEFKGMIYGRLYGYQGKLYRAKKDYKEAEKYLLKSIKASESDPATSDMLVGKIEALLELADLYFDIGDLEKSFKSCMACEGLIEEADYNIALPNLYRLLGKIYIKQGDSGKGQEYYDKAFEILNNR